MKWSMRNQRMMEGMLRYNQPLAIIMDTTGISEIVWHNSSQGVDLDQMGEVIRKYTANQEPKPLATTLSITFKWFT